MHRRSLALALLLSVPAASAFELAPLGPFTSLESAVGQWSAEGGHASIHPGHAKTGSRSLRLAGNGERTAVLTLNAAAEENAVLSFHAERWTRRDPFSFRIDARSSGEWTEIHNADQDIKVGGFLTEVRLNLPKGTRELRFRAHAPADTGILLDDFQLHRPGPATATRVETVQPVCPAFIRSDFNPVLGFRVVVEGSEGSVNLEALEIGFEGTTHLADIESFRIVAGTADPSAIPGATVAEGTPVAKRLTLTTSHSMASGEHWFWISPILKNDTSIDGKIDAAVYRLKVSGTILEPQQPSPDGDQRIGFAVRLPGDDGSKSYRIPALATSRTGTLIAAYDVRYDHSGDLPANIDVGVSRSTDGGQSWEPMRIAIDMGNDPKHASDGVGDPAVLVDPANGRIWIVALWSHGNRSFHGSGPGLEPTESGQVVMVYSDDDGKTWSEPRNITRQVKDPKWRLLFNGPGAGIALRDGTLVFAAQYRAADGPPDHGKPFSTLIWSNDQGETWNVGTGVKIDTTEAQLAELADGTIMINCRDDRGGARTVATTADLGATWQLHPTDRKALREPVCMASLLGWQHPQHGDLLWFSNPNTTGGRYDLTLKLSTDQGQSWPESHHVLYDSRHGFGYSCLSPVGDDRLGVLYEGKSTLYFLRFPLGELKQ
jgi:sialidase-1